MRLLAAALSVSLVVGTGCKSAPRKPAPENLNEVNAELEALRRNRTAAVDAGPVSTLAIPELESVRSESAPSTEDAGAAADTLGDAGEATTPQKKKKRKPVRLPAPLRPHAPDAPPESDAPKPCTIVVSRICSILTDGAEECSEARALIPKLDNVDAQQRCADTLAWYERRFSDERRTRPCALLADVVCRQSGPKSTQCRRARGEVKLLRKTLTHACKAEILMVMGLR